VGRPAAFAGRSTSLRSRHALVLVGLFVASLALRPQIIGVGPLLPQVKADLGISHTVEGLLSTIPVLCMGLFAPLAALLAARFGARAAIAGAIALIAVGGMLRVASPHALVLLLFTLPVGIGIAIAGTLMPVAVKERFSHRPGFATGVYAAGIQAGSTIAAALAVPLAQWHGGWRFSLLVCSAATVVLVPLWLLSSSGSVERPLKVVTRPRLPWRSVTVWRFVAVFALVGMNFYALSHWLANAYVEHGWSEHRAGWLLTAFQAATVPSGLLMTWLADRVGSRRLYMVSASLLMCAALIGVIEAPGASWLWVILLGWGNGTMFGNMMALPLDVSDRPAEAGAVAAMMLGVGYTLSALLPFTLGAIRDATGSFTGALWVLVGVVLVSAAVCWTITGERLRRGVGPARAAG